MPDLDPELLERAVRWCAEAGRHVGAADVRRALSPLGWDELLAVRALLADPPPARPLGPLALADLARGAPADVAAEREREGRYRSEPEAVAEGAPGEAAAAPSPAARRGRRRGAEIVIRRARDRAESPAPVPAPRPPLDELRRPEGRAVLDRLVRRHGARRAPILAALAEGWTGPGGAPPGDAELSALLDHHGLARAFERRERDELLHALRAAGGVRPLAAERVGLDPGALAAALARLGATAEAERIREDRRAELRGRATLAERVRLLLSQEARLRDLELLDAFERDLRARLPEHLRALRAGGEPVSVALARSLSLPRPDAEALALRFGLDLGAAGKGAPSRARGPGRSGAPRPSPRPRRGGSHAPRPGGARGRGAPLPRGERSAPGPGAPRPGKAPGGAPPARPGAASGSRGPRPRSAGARPGGAPRGPGGGPRPTRGAAAPGPGRTGPRRPRGGGRGG